MEFTFVSIAATKPSTPNPFDITLLILPVIKTATTQIIFKLCLYISNLITLGRITTALNCFLWKCSFLAKLLCSLGDSEVRLDGRCLRGEFIFNVVWCWRNDNECEVGRLKVGVECGTMETVRSLILAPTEECLGDWSLAQQPTIKRTGPASCWFF